MDRDTFDQSLRALVRREPFEPFVVEFVSGASIRVTHPEAVAFNVGVGIHVDEVGAPTLFDHTTVCRLSGVPNTPV